MDKKWFSKEKQSHIFVAQEPAIRTNAIKTRIEQSQKENKCRICGPADVTVNYVLTSWHRRSISHNKIGLVREYTGKYTVSLVSV